MEGIVEGELGQNEESQITEADLQVFQAEQVNGREERHAALALNIGHTRNMFSDHDENWSLCSLKSPLVGSYLTLCLVLYINLLHPLY